MSSPHKCPVCEGTGKKPTRGLGAEPCHACNGQGVVWSPEDQRESATVPSSPLEINGL